MLGVAFLFYASLMCNTASKEGEDEGGSGGDSSSSSSPKQVLLGAATGDALSNADGQSSVWEHIDGETVDVNKSPNLLVYANTCQS